MFDFTVKYRSSIDNSNADCLSRLSMKNYLSDKPGEVGIFQIRQLEMLPITSKDIAWKTLQDPDLRGLENDVSMGVTDKRFALYEI